MSSSQSVVCVVVVSTDGCILLRLLAVFQAVVFAFELYFQAEDGIRDTSVTGVQTCALPICFFLQAEDGIRDTSVTGVQTCALPICISGYTYLNTITYRHIGFA